MSLWGDRKVSPIFLFLGNAEYMYESQLIEMMHTYTSQQNTCLTPILPQLRRHLFACIVQVVYFCGRIDTECYSMLPKRFIFLTWKITAQTLHPLIYLCFRGLSTPVLPQQVFKDVILHFVGRVFCRSIRQMCINIQREFDCCVPKHLGNCLRINPILQR